MGIFSNIKEARGTEGGLYLEPGNYLVQINRCKMIETHAGAPMFIAELLLLESDNEKLKVGSEPSYTVKFGGEYPKLALGNVADFMRACLASMADALGEERPEDISEVEIDEPTAEAITGEENLAAGVYLTCKAFNKKTKKDNKDFTRTKWGVPENLAELLANAA